MLSFPGPCCGCLNDFCHSDPLKSSWLTVDGGLELPLLTSPATSVWARQELSGASPRKAGAGRHGGAVCFAERDKGLMEICYQPLVATPQWQTLGNF